MAAIVLSAAAPSALAQDDAFIFTCQDVGESAVEQLGDREGHSITVSEASCRVDSGLLAGGS